MVEQKEFEMLIQRLRDGDERAASELVSQFEPEVRRFVRFRLTTPAVRRFIDSLDVSQSVLAKFFVELKREALEIDGPDQLRNLLLTMARNKLYDHARKARSGKRDIRRMEGEAEINRVADSSDSPSEMMASAEIVERVRACLSADDLYLVDQRMNGRPWGDLAVELQINQDALRKRMSRAVDRAAKDLGVIP